MHANQTPISAPSLMGTLALIAATLVSIPAVSTTIPSQADWEELGVAFDGGLKGDWDFHLIGAFATTMIKKDGKYFLYYQGADGFRAEDNTVTHRSLGVATSSDGRSFTKYPGNPILRWSPTGNVEEGVFSASAWLEEDGEIALFWGALTSTNRTSLSVSGDGRLAASANGFDFLDIAQVLDHRDASVWGSGDELSPIAAFEHQGTWYVYYIPNGTPQGHTLGLASGPRRNRLNRSRPVTSGGRTIPVWGSASYVPINDHSFVLFLNNEGTIDARIGTYAAPGELSAPIETYRFPGLSEEATIFLDTDSDTWFLFYRQDRPQRYVAITATSLGIRAPSRLKAKARSSTTVRLRWKDRSDNESSFDIQMKLERKEKFRTVATVPADVRRVLISDLEPGTTHTFRVRARAGREKSKFSDRATVTTPPSESRESQLSPNPPADLGVSASPILSQDLFRRQLGFERNSLQNREHDSCRLPHRACSV